MKTDTGAHSLIHFLLALALCGSTVASAVADFYVDPVSGNDANNGTSTATAFRTLGRSRQAVAAVNAGMTEDITVHLRGGIHRLSSTLTLGPTDSGTNDFDVVYRNYANETPVISGGVDLSGGWVLHDAVRNIYRKSGVTFAFRQLYVNASTAVRARTPNQTDADTFGPYLTMTGVKSANKQAIIKPEDISNWSNLTNVEMVMNPHWYHYRGRISSYTTNATQALVTFRAPESNTLFNKGDGFWPNTPYFFENSIDFLDAEGEWFLDTSSTTLYYKPRSGENMSTTAIEAPLLDTLVQLSGTSSSNKVRNVRFEGLAFTQAGWNGPSINGSSMTQGCREIVTKVRQGAITAQYADNLEFASCSFRFLGFNAISYVKGVTGGSIYNCDFRWISANGIVIHDDGVANPAAGDACQDIQIVNNSIARVGQQYSNGIGIVSYFVKRMLIADNEISYGPYMGTQTGGQSGANIDVGMKDNILRNNYVHHIMQFHDDGGAFYTLGRQQGTHVVDNWADTLLATRLTGSYSVAGLYADNYSEFITYERNATVNCTKATYEQTGSGAKNNRWLSNVTTADPAITRYAGRKTNYFWPVKHEAESMTISGGTVESGAFYSNEKGITFSAAGNLSASFDGPGGNYNINTAYVTGDTGAAGYRLLVNGAQADAWTASPTPVGTGLQIRHRITRLIALAAGDTITLEATPASGTPAKVDYVEIYTSQIAVLTAPGDLRASVVSGTRIALAWEGATGAATYDIHRAESKEGPFATIATGVTGTSWMDSRLVQGRPYFYYVTATNAGGTSLASETVSAIPHPFSSTCMLEASADAYVQRGNPMTNFGSATQVVVKNAPTTSIHRKGYIRFDLTGQKLHSTPKASLQMVAGTWNETLSWQIYGLNNGDAGESWIENSITWNNAPANITATGDTLDGSRVTFLGTLAPAGIPPVGAVLELRSAALDAFLLADTNHQVTFVLIRTTSSTTGNSAVASRESTTLAAPALEFARVVLDSDGDGYEDAFETANGSNPFNASSIPLKITGAEFQSGAFAVTTSGLSPFIPYVLKRSADLSDGFPVMIGTPFYATDPPATLSDAAPPPGKAFYRIEPLR